MTAVSFSSFYTMEVEEEETKNMLAYTHCRTTLYVRIYVLNKCYNTDGVDSKK